MLTAELGAGPLALARAQRAQTARILIETTDLGLADIAFAAGFGSVRQFNDTILDVYARPPGALRERRPAVQGGAGTINLRLAYRPPLHAGALLDYLSARALPGVEECDGATYRRGLTLPHGTGTAALTPADRWISVTLRLGDVRDLAPAVARCRRLFDLDADPVAIDETLGADPALAPAVRAEPGVRVPRAADGFEAVLRAVIGQQVSVRSAVTTLTHLLRAVHPPDEPGGADGPVGADEPGGAGGPGTLRGFVSAADVAGAADAALRMPAARREAVRAVARAVAAGDIDLEPGADGAEAAARLRALPGIGPWTAGYVAMRALGDPDVMLATDLAARRGAGALGLPDTAAALARHAEMWRPWRSYALVRLWRRA
jgi:AraC family transcriptional regulator of adaptative response / DNA-3-methyladenine glycosylase II